MAKERQMVSVGWEGRASGCGAEVSGHHGTDPARAACGAEPTSSGGITLGDGSLMGGLEAQTQLRQWSWSDVPGLGVVPCRQLPERAPPSCHRAWDMPPGDPQILEVNMNLRRGPLSLLGTMMKNTTSEIQVSMLKRLYS